MNRTDQDDFETITPDALAATTGGFSAQDGMAMFQQFMPMIQQMIGQAGGGQQQQAPQQ